MTMNDVIGFANAAGERWAAWAIAASMDAPVLLGLVALVWAVPLSSSAVLMFAWLAGVVAPSTRLIGIRLRLRGRLRQASPLVEPISAVDLAELRRRVGVSATIRVAEHDAIASPAVWGISRPTIILPRGIASDLTPQQLRWVLLHELAHVRRDLAILLVQRVAAILRFYNPAVWVANRVIHQLREYACDDLAVTLDRASAVESGEAFVRRQATARS